MRVLDLTFKKPAQNLALDEILLEEAEAGKTGDTLRFWESDSFFVVLGISQILRREVEEKNCREDNVPILRRASAGGCVLQGPGCLNYSFVLARNEHRELATIRGSYCYILGRIAEALRKRGLSVRHKGISDLALSGKKVSGSAQKRRKRYILHHGTLLYKIDAGKMERYLREPAERPQYRGPRTHRGFVRALPLTPRELKDAVLDAFDIGAPAQRAKESEVREAKDLARDKHAAIAWIRRR